MYGEPIEVSPGHYWRTGPADPPFDCIECGKHYDPANTMAVLRVGLCFACDHWQAKVDWTKDSDEEPWCFRVDGTHYHAAPLAGRGSSRGFGAATFVIEMVDGRRFSVRNLWCQGDIPPHFQKRLPDNARFLSYEERAILLKEPL